MKRTGILLAAALLMMKVAFAGNTEFVQKLEQEEGTWHKYFVFTTAVSATNREDRSAAMEWLRDRIKSGSASDSRYAITYSNMLWATRNPNAMDEAIIYAVAGYLALQIESARCETRNESIQIARQWYDPITPQMQKWLALPKEEKETVFLTALDYGNRLSSVPASESKPGSDWICYLLPSYQSRIVKLPDVNHDSRQQGKFTMVFTSHPVVKPIISSEQQLSDRKKAIIDNMRK